MTIIVRSSVFVEHRCGATLPEPCGEAGRVLQTRSSLFQKLRSETGARYFLFFRTGTVCSFFHVAIHSFSSQSSLRSHCGRCRFCTAIGERRESVCVLPEFVTSRVKFQDFSTRVHRTTYFAGTVASIIFDYWWSFRKLEDGTPEELEMEHIVNQRSAERLFRMCEYAFRSPVTRSHLGGYFAKFGQIISTFDKGVPPEYVEVLKQCQVGAAHVLISRTA